MTEQAKRRCEQARQPAHERRSLPVDEVFAMPKNPDERIEILEKKVNLYRVLVTLIVLLLLVVEIKPIHNIIDRMRSWVENVSSKS